MPADLIPEPWLSFFSELDEIADQSIDFHCFGGFVVTIIYGASAKHIGCRYLDVCAEGKFCPLDKFGAKGVRFARSP